MQYHKTCICIICNAGADLDRYREKKWRERFLALKGSKRRRYQDTNVLNKVHTKFKRIPDKNWSRYSWSAIVIILLWCGQKFRNNLPWSVPQYIIYKSFTPYSVGTNHLLKFFNIYYYFLDRGMLHPRVNGNYKQRAQTVLLFDTHHWLRWFL